MLDTLIINLTAVLTPVTAFDSPFELLSASIGLPVPFISTLGFLASLSATGIGRPPFRLTLLSSSISRPSRLPDSFLGSGLAVPLSPFRLAGVPLTTSSVDARRTLEGVDDWPCWKKQVGRRQVGSGQRAVNSPSGLNMAARFIGKSYRTLSI